MLPDIVGAVLSGGGSASLKGGLKGAQFLDDAARIAKTAANSSRRTARRIRELANAVTRSPGRPAMDFIGGRTGRLGGELYDTKRLAQLESFLGRRGITLKVGDKHVPRGAQGGFGFAADGKPIMILRSNPTKYEVWHELSHFIHWQKLGTTKYRALHRFTGTGRQDIPEQFVFDMLENGRHWKLLNDAGRAHAINYIHAVGGIR